MLELIYIYTFTNLYIRRILLKILTFRVDINYFYYFVQINSYKNMNCIFKIFAIILLYKILILIYFFIIEINANYYFLYNYNLFKNYL